MYTEKVINFLVLGFFIFSADLSAPTSGEMTVWIKHYIFWFILVALCIFATYKRKSRELE